MSLRSDATWEDLSVDRPASEDTPFDEMVIKNCFQFAEQVALPKGKG
jgi:hypothetical protein